MTEKALARGRRVAVVDLETSGLSSRRNRILQMAVVIADVDGNVESTWSTLVAPRWWRLVRVGPTHIHGIRRRDLRDAPPISLALADLAERLDDALIVAHNIRFDWAFLTRAADRAGVTLPAGDRLCTLELSRRLDPDRIRSHRLTDLARHYGIEHDEPHHALSDALATAALLPHLTNEAAAAGHADLVDQLVLR